MSSSNSLDNITCENKDCDWGNIPDEILREISSWCIIKSLFALRQCCKYYSKGISLSLIGDYCKGLIIRDLQYHLDLLMSNRNEELFQSLKADLKGDILYELLKKVGFATSPEYTLKLFERSSKSQGVTYKRPFEKLQEEGYNYELFRIAKIPTHGITMDTQQCNTKLGRLVLEYRYPYTLICNYDEPQCEILKSLNVSRGITVPLGLLLGENSISRVYRLHRKDEPFGPLINKRVDVDLVPAIDTCWDLSKERFRLRDLDNMVMSKYTLDITRVPPEDLLKVSLRFASDVLYHDKNIFYTENGQPPNITTSAELTLLDPRTRDFAWYIRRSLGYKRATCPADKFQAITLIGETLALLFSRTVDKLIVNIGFIQTDDNCEAYERREVHMLLSSIVGNPFSKLKDQVTKNLLPVLNLDRVDNIIEQCYDDWDSIRHLMHMIRVANSIAHPTHDSHSYFCEDEYAQSLTNWLTLGYEWKKYVIPMFTSYIEKTLSESDLNHIIQVIVNCYCKSLMSYGVNELYERICDNPLHVTDTPTWKHTVVFRNINWIEFKQALLPEQLALLNQHLDDLPNSEGLVITRLVGEEISEDLGDDCYVLWTFKEGQANITHSYVRDNLVIAFIKDEILINLLYCLMFCC